MGWFFSDYRVSPNFFVALGLGCDNKWDQPTTVQRFTMMVQTIAMLLQTENHR